MEWKQQNPRKYHKNYISEFFEKCDETQYKYHFFSDHCFGVNVTSESACSFFISSDKSELTKLLKTVRMSNTYRWHWRRVFPSNWSDTISIFNLRPQPSEKSVIFWKLVSVGNLSIPSRQDSTSRHAPEWILLWHP